MFSTHLVQVHCNLSSPDAISCSEAPNISKAYVTFQTKWWQRLIKQEAKIKKTIHTFLPRRTFFGGGEGEQKIQIKTYACCKPYLLTTNLGLWGWNTHWATVYNSWPDKTALDIRLMSFHHLTWKVGEGRNKKVKLHCQVAIWGCLMSLIAFHYLILVSILRTYIGLWQFLVSVLMCVFSEEYGELDGKTKYLACSVEKKKKKKQKKNTHDSSQPGIVAKGSSSIPPFQRQALTDEVL